MPDEQPITRTEMVALLIGLKQDLKQDMQNLKQEIFESISERIEAAELRGWKRGANRDPAPHCVPKLGHASQSSAPQA